MATRAAVAVAVGILTAANMLPRDDDADEQIKAWCVLLDPAMTDRDLEAAVKKVAGEKTYGHVKPSDVNAAVAGIRSQRIRTWLTRHSVPTEGRGGFEQAAYSRGFLRAIGSGADTVTADQYGRAALTQAQQVANNEPDTPLHELLSRMDRAMKDGREPWANNLPTARPLTAIDAAPRQTITGKAHAQAALKQIKERINK